MPKLTFLTLAERVLQLERRPLNAEEIWEAAVRHGLDKELNSSGKTPIASVGARLYVDAKQPESDFYKEGSRPVRFFLKSLQAKFDVEKLTEEPIIPEKPRPTYSERDLHPHLVYFASTNLNAYCKTISHSRSDKKEYGEWVHPDLVACYFPIDVLRPEVVEFTSAIGTVAIKLFSFELKRVLNFSNLREAFFQAVSNSSWANEGYLVAAEISVAEDFQDELKRLTTSFGIGVIQLDVTDPDASEILYPARSRENLDIDAMDKLAMNSDFLSFLKRVRADLTTKEIRAEWFDPVLKPEDLTAAIRKAK
jgi:hypothetical protein